MDGQDQKTKNSRFNYVIRSDKKKLFLEFDNYLPVNKIETKNEINSDLVIY